MYLFEEGENIQLAEYMQFQDGYCSHWLAKHWPFSIFCVESYKFHQ